MNYRFAILVGCVLLVLALMNWPGLDPPYSGAAVAVPTTTPPASTPTQTPPPTATPSPSTLQPFPITSSALGGQRDTNVYLPPGYADLANAQRRYPVLYLLHGAPGAYRDWTDAAGLQATVDSMISTGTLAPLIIVLPDGNYGALGDSQWVNGNTDAGFGRVEDFLVQELVPAVDAQFRTLAGRAGRAIGGLSAGAYGAFNLAVRHPELFSIVAVHSGFYRAQPTDDGTDVFAGDQDAENANSPIEHLDDAALRSLAIYFDVGSDDPWFYDDALELDQELNARAIPHEFHIFPGGHTWDYWSEHVGDALRFVNAHFARADAVQ